MKAAPFILPLVFAVGQLFADTEAITAGELAERVRTPDGAAEIRLRMQNADGSTYQLRVLERRRGSSHDVAYEILFPKDRQGEKVVLHQSGNSSPTGTLVKADGSMESLDGKMSAPLFGGRLALADVIEDFFTWSNQTLAGREEIGRVNCVVLESTPSGWSIYGKVKSWIDPSRMVPLRVEKYLPSGKLARRIETTRVVPHDGRSIPADLSVESPEASGATTLDGSSIRDRESMDDSEFSPN